MWIHYQQNILKVAARGDSIMLTVKVIIENKFIVVVVGWSEISHVLSKKLTAKSPSRPWLLQFKFRGVVSFWVNKNLNDKEDDEAKMCRDKLREEGEKGTKNVVSFLGSVWLTGWSGWVPSSWRVIGDEFGFLSQSDSDVISAQRQWITHQSYEETLFNPLTQFCMNLLPDAVSP